MSDGSMMVIMWVADPNAELKTQKWTKKLEVHEIETGGNTTETCGGNRTKEAKLNTAPTRQMTNKIE